MFSTLPYSRTFVRRTLQFMRFPVARWLLIKAWTNLTLSYAVSSWPDPPSYILAQEHKPASSK